MKTLTLFFALLILAPGQKVTTHTLKVSAGSIHCTFTNLSPPALTGLHVDCLSPTSSLKLDTVLTPTGTTGTFLSERDSLTWIFQLPSPGPALYKVNSNGKIETGSL